MGGTLIEGPDRTGGFSTHVLGRGGTDRRASRYHMTHCWVLRERVKPDLRARVLHTLVSVKRTREYVGPVDLRTAGVEPVSVGSPAGTARSLRTAQWTRASLIFVVKFLRAIGGCLGIRSRRRTS